MACTCLSTEDCKSRQVSMSDFVLKYQTLDQYLCVMRSSKMSLNLPRIQSYILLKTHQNYAYGSRDIAILVMLKTIKYKEN